MKQSSVLIGLAAILLNTSAAMGASISWGGPTAITSAEQALFKTREVQYAVAWGGTAQTVSLSGAQHVTFTSGSIDGAGVIGATRAVGITGPTGANVAPAAVNGVGMFVQPFTPAIARNLRVDATVQGVVITQLDESSDASRVLMRGDVISSIDRTPVRSAGDLAAAVTQAKAAGRPTVLLYIYRRAVSGFISVKIK